MLLFYVDVRPILMSTCKLFMYVDMHLINKVHINIHMTHNLFNVDPQDIMVTCNLLNNVIIVNIQHTCIYVDLRNEYVDMRLFMLICNLLRLINMHQKFYVKNISHFNIIMLYIQLT